MGGRAAALDAACLDPLRRARSAWVSQEGRRPSNRPVGAGAVGWGRLGRIRRRSKAFQANR